MDTTAYKIILLLHIAAAIVGFGGVIAHGAYNAKAFASKAGQAKAILSVTQSVTNIAHYAIYGVLVLGVILISLSSGGNSEGISMGAPWVSASFVVWFALVGVAHGLVKPTVRGLLSEAEGMADNDEMTANPSVLALAKKLALGEGLTQLLLVIAIILMIWKPGN
ncbi:MAG: DUF2269 family protein [Acidimicrobiales bacterium]